MVDQWIRGLALGLAVALTGCAAGVGANVELGPDTFGVWDVNDDAFLDRNEFGVNWDDEFGAWDTDDSGFVEEDEFGIGVGMNDDEFGMFAEWDMNDDNLLSDDEFGVGSFGVFDDDDDGLISDDEWGADVGLWD